MANPRNSVDCEGIAPVFVTYKIDNSTITYDATKAFGAATTMIGKAVTLSADDTVALCADGDAIEGKLVKVESDLKCTVQTGGYTDLPGGDSATLTRGSAIVGALGAASAKGYIRTAASGTAAELIKCRGRIIRNGTATAVVVDLT
jgi:hypothetical protein